MSQPTETSKEKAARLRKQIAKKEMSLIIKIMESDLYDWSPTARLLLVAIAYSQVQDEDAYFPEDCPEPYYSERIGWNWMSQWRLALRVGVTVRQVQRWLDRMEQDGVIRMRTWTDDNNAHHNLYQVVEEVVDAHQRPEQSATVERPLRYKKKAPNRGRFTSQNQPSKKAMAAAAETFGAQPVVDDEDEL